MSRYTAWVVFGRHVPAWKSALAAVAKASNGAFAVYESEPPFTSVFSGSSGHIQVLATPETVGGLMADLVLDDSVREKGRRILGGAACGAVVVEYGKNAADQKVATVVVDTLMQAEAVLVNGNLAVLSHTSFRDCLRNGVAWDDVQTNAYFDFLDTV